jgi:DNA adenine methylase
MTTGAQIELKPTRPVLRYHGGKWELAPWIVAHLPPHRSYVEPFGGAASVLLQKPRSYSEVYNDLDGEIVNLFEVLRDSPLALIEAVNLTPFAREEYRLAFRPAESPVERARRTLVRSHMGFAGAATHGRMTGFRSSSSRSGTHPAMQWRGLPDHLQAVIDRMRGVVLENRDAFEVMAQQDAPGTLFYVDPPYLPSTRDAGTDYRFEMSEDCHNRLAHALRGLEGMVVMSGYPSELYDHALFADWHRVQREALAEQAKVRTEVLWLNTAATAALEKSRQQRTLLEMTG